MNTRERKRPLVSILMVTYGRAELGLEALSAVQSSTEIPHEVIVVDNASPDGTADTIAAGATGIRLIRSPANAGFGAGINRAALEASGRHLCILNSDAIVRPGWLPPMLEHLEDPAVGAVVPLYLNEDGTVQEAGSSVGSDGWTWAHGRGLSADSPEVAFQREVDFGSAACMLVRRSAFVAAGGFHPAYGVGYYEDVDLCLTLRRKGLRTVFEPRSRVVHAGESSSDHATAAARMAANREVFLTRWGDALAGRPKLGDLERFPHRVVHARDALAPLRLLLIDEGSEETTITPWLDAAADLAGEGVRVTVAGASATGERVERADAIGPSFLADRALHATVVVLRGPDSATRHLSSVLEHQPQAVLLYDMTDGAGTSQHRAAEVEALRAATVIVAPGDARALLARELAPGTPVVTASSPEPAPAVHRALALAGLTAERWSRKPLSVP